MVGTTHPLRLDRADFQRKLSDSTTREALERIGIRTFESLLARYTAGPRELRRFAGEGPVLTDDRPSVEFFLSLPRDEPTVDLSSLGGDVRRHVVP
ncbi:MAG: hypothetical protein LC804_13920 [Acidobacteria bacterium]|nr:hypothetical protein [Acidobacteriota bacterium]